MNNLLRLLQPIRRIRGNRLYGADGKRLLDLWLDGGHGLLGEREKAAILYACNAAEKGLTRAYPGFYETGFLKSLKFTWPEFETAFIFANEERAIASLASTFKKNVVISESFGSDAKRMESSENIFVGLARPFSVLPSCFDVVLTRLPCPRPFAPACVLAKKEKLPPNFRGEMIPPLMHHAASRALDTLARSTADGYAEEHWNKFGLILEKHFLRSGPYLFRRDGAIEYDRLFAAALSGGALISPNADEPSIVPPDFSPGEAKNLALALDALYP